MPFMHRIKVSLFLSLCLSLVACTGSRPAHLGSPLKALEACPESPNCVSSQASKDDEEHYIEALGDWIPGLGSPINVLAAVVEKDPDAEIIVRSEHYLYAEYTSDLLRFVDDVEFLFQPETGLMQVRSASRLGYADFGVNRERIEAIRKQLQSSP